jgi:hypothetical protein
MSLPKALLDEISAQLQAGLSPHDVAEAVGRRGKLDFGEISSVRAAAIAIQQNLAET